MADEQIVYRVRNKETGKYLQHYWWVTMEEFRCSWTDIVDAHLFLGESTAILLAWQHGGIVERCSVHLEGDLS